MFKDDADAAARAEFEKEGKMLAIHPHRNFVQLLGTSVDGPKLVLVTAYMAGGCVRAALGAATTLTWRQRLVAAVGACRGLEFLHNSLKKVRLPFLRIGISSRVQLNYTHAGLNAGMRVLQ